MTLGSLTCPHWCLRHGQPHQAEADGTVHHDGEPLTVPLADDRAVHVHRTRQDHGGVAGPERLCLADDRQVLAWLAEGEAVQLASVLGRLSGRAAEPGLAGRRA